MRSIFVVVETGYDEDHGYQAYLIYEGVRGIYPTGQFFGHDYELAAEIAHDKNIALGISPEHQSWMIAYAFDMDQVEGEA